MGDRSTAESVHPTPPPMMDEYQKKRLTKFAFRKWQIPKDMFLGAHLAGARDAAPKKKSGSKLPHSKRSDL